MESLAVGVPAAEDAPFAALRAGEFGALSGRTVEFVVGGFEGEVCDVFGWFGGGEGEESEEEGEEGGDGESVGHLGAAFVVRGLLRWRVWMVRWPGCFVGFPEHSFFIAGRGGQRRNVDVFLVSSLPPQSLSSRHSASVTLAARCYCFDISLFSTLRWPSASLALTPTARPSDP